MPYRLDFLHEYTKVVVELSGGVHSIQARRRGDYEKARWLTDYGYTLYQFDAGYDTAKCRIDDNMKQVYNAIISIEAGRIAHELERCS